MQGRSDYGTYERVGSIPGIPIQATSQFSESVHDEQREVAFRYVILIKSWLKVIFNT